MASKKEIDLKNFEELCKMQCTKEEICGFFSISDKTLDRWVKETYGDDTSFSEVFRQKRQGGKCSLRRKQWKMADKSAAMAIFLGKQYLDQKDKVETEQNGTINVTIDGQDSKL